MQTHPPRFILTCGVAALIAATARPAAADIYDWNTGNTGDYGTAGNWTNESNGSNAVPTSGNVASIINGGTATLNSGNYAADEIWAGNNGNGNAGNGNLIVNGGTLTANNWLVAGRQGSSVGSITQTGGTIIQGNAGNRIQVGEGGGTGTMTLSNNAVLQSVGTLAVGLGNNATGTMTIGGNANVTVGGETWIGAEGSQNANLMTVNGGTFAFNSWFVVGRDGSTGTFTMNGGTVTKATASSQNTGFFDVGGTSTATATVNLNGGVLAVDKVATESTRAIFNFNGGTLQATGNGAATAFGVSAASFLDRFAQANVRNGGATVDTNGNNITFDQTLQHSAVGGDAATDGGLTKTGTGTLTLTAANTYTGRTTVSVGTLALGPNGSIANSNQVRIAAGATFSVNATTAFSVPAAQTLTGTGILAGGSSNLTLSGILAPGATPAVGTVGTLSIATTGTLTLAGTTQFDLLAANNKDLISATGANLTLGGVLALNAGASLPAGTYTLFSGLNGVSGAFSSVTGVPAGERASFTYDAANRNYNLVLTAVPEPSSLAAGVFLSGAAAGWLRRRRVE